MWRFFSRSVKCPSVESQKLFKKIRSDFFVCRRTQIEVNLEKLARSVCASRRKKRPNLFEEFMRLDTSVESHKFFAKIQVSPKKDRLFYLPPNIHFCRAEINLQLMARLCLKSHRHFSYRQSSFPERFHRPFDSSEAHL